MRSWHRDQAKQILKEAKARYGKGWCLLSKHQQQNYLHAQVLMLLITQSEERFKPAQELVTGVLFELRQEDQDCSTLSPAREFSLGRFFILLGIPRQFISQLWSAIATPR